MHLNFGRSDRSFDRSTTPPEPASAPDEPSGEAPGPEPAAVEVAVSPIVEVHAFAEPQTETAPFLEDMPLVEDAPPASAAGFDGDALPGRAAAVDLPAAPEVWPDADPDAAPPEPAAVRGSRNGDPAPVGLTAPTAPTGWTDPMTSADGPHFWDRLISSERDRIRRYHRPATIVFIELGNLDELGALWGEDVAAQSLIKVGRTLMREIRSSDHAARIDVARFAVFLPETSEIAAINFVERVRAAIDASLGFMDQTLRVGIGWASPGDGDIDVALIVAEQRLDADLGRA
jgi:diguanylate cyclase (GGDEF)-like protein